MYNYFYCSTNDSLVFFFFLLRKFLLRMNQNYINIYKFLKSYIHFIQINFIAYFRFIFSIRITNIGILYNSQSSAYNTIVLNDRYIIERRLFKLIGMINLFR